MSETEAPASAVADRMAAARAARAAKAAAKTAEAPASAVAEAVAEPEVRVEQISPAGPTTMEKAAATEADVRARKVAALRAAKFADGHKADDPLVLVRVTKKGHGQVSMGEHVNGLGDLTYDHNETPSLPRSVALELEERGFVEIQ
jgi:hypothetical protein